MLIHAFASGSSLPHTSNEAVVARKGLSADQQQMPKGHYYLRCWLLRRWELQLCARGWTCSFIPLFGDDLQHAGP